MKTEDGRPKSRRWQTYEFVRSDPIHIKNLVKIRKDYYGLSSRASSFVAIFLTVFIQMWLVFWKKKLQQKA